MHSIVIPPQIVLTGPGTLLELPADLRRNAERIMSANSGFQVKWFSDADCHSYIARHFDAELAGMFRREYRGSFRGDLCRTAVLYREGGFYVDLDVELLVPLTSLVGLSTTFMSAYTFDGAMLNAIMASEPFSSILYATLVELRKWYRGQVPRIYDVTVDGNDCRNGWMGPLTLHRGIRNFMQAVCPSVVLSASHLDAACGTHALRFYRERELQCTVGKESRECSDERARSPFAGSKYGLFAPGPEMYRERLLIGWPRFEACRSRGCSEAFRWERPEEHLQLDWLLRARMMPCVCPEQFQSAQKLITGLIFSLPAKEQLGPACDRFRPFIEAGDLECATAVVSSSLLCASAASGIDPKLARTFLARALQASLGGSTLLCYEEMWLIRMDEILDNFYRSHMPEFAEATLNWTMYNSSSEAFSRTPEQLASSIIRVRSALALFGSSAKPSTPKTVRKDTITQSQLGLALATLEGGG